MKSSLNNFITFEGGEGAGKTTLVEKVHKALSSKGLSVFQTRAPGGSKLGSGIRELLLHKNFPIDRKSELFLFLADRAQHVEETILPALKEGQIVLCDRFNDSTIAYQTARGLDEKKIREFLSFATGGLEPILTIYLDIDPNIGFQRIKKDGVTKDRIESEHLDFHQKIRETFHHIGRREPKRFHIIDASASPETVFNNAMKLIYDLLSSHGK